MSSKSASLRAMDRSRSIWVCTSLKAQYTPAGLPSGPRTAADWVRTSTLPPSLVRSANSCTWRPGASMADINAALDLFGVRGPHGPAGESAPPHGLGRRPPENALGLAVPVGEDPLGVEGAQGGVHAVQQRGKQIGAVRLGLVRPQLVRGPTTPGSTHLDPLQAASVCTARQFAHSSPFNSNVTQPTPRSPKMGKSMYAGFPHLPPQESRSLASRPRSPGPAPPAPGARSHASR